MNNDMCFLLAYLSPMRLIVHEKEHIHFSLEEINNCTYNNFILCRIIGKITNTYKGISLEYSICGDGALAINTNNSPLSQNDYILHFNDLLCKLLIGGVYVECLDTKDFTSGALHDSNKIWPVNFGNSLSSHLHSCIRMKLTNSFDAILLDGATSSAKTLSEINVALQKGAEIIDKIQNISTFYLISGVTEIMYYNWSSGVSNLWIVVEQIIDFLWYHRFLTDSEKNPDIPMRKQAMMQDNRTYSAVVKQELLYQAGILPENVYSKLYSARKARNKLVHEGYMVNSKVATDLYNSVDVLLQIATNQCSGNLLPVIKESNVTINPSFKD